MTLPNQETCFEGFPIEFKKINPQDFPNFEVAEKVNLELSDGYIGDSFIENISIEEPNTVVVNCGVGSGKTTAIIRAIKQFYDREEFVIFIASPFVSLVQQYFLDVQSKAEIPTNDIYRNEWIGERQDITYTDKKVHIVTINTLLGNPGEKKFINSIHKRKYLNDMVSYCEANNKRAIFIYDEIHDSIHNFKQKYIFNLWKWRNIIHKNFVISATYNEASKVVVEYLAELTENKIKILEAERVRIPEKLSDLYLYYDNARGYNNENGNLISIVEKAFQKDLNIDILCYSKKLCQKIVEEKEKGVGKLLFEKYGEDINLCVSGLDEFGDRPNRNVGENRFDNSKCNVGTNFKSGVSIEKENHAFILILPPSSSRNGFNQNYGIFSGGINSIIQALARKRKKGEIHILLPKPTKFNFESFPFNSIQKEKFKNFFTPIQYIERTSNPNRISDTKTIDYISLENQDEVLNDFYTNTFKANVLDSIEHIESISESRIDKPELEFPTFKGFKLAQGENYLSSWFKFLGADLSGYISYCAATNQFVNCNWIFSNNKPFQNLKIGKLQYCFEDFYRNYLELDSIEALNHQVSDMYLYEDIRTQIFSNYQVKLYGTNGSYEILKPYKNRDFELQFIAFVHRKVCVSNSIFNKRFNNNGYLQDSEYTRGYYFLSCISHSLRINSNQATVENDNQSLKSAYITLERFRNKIKGLIQEKIIKGVNVQYINKTPENNFMNELEITLFNNMVSILVEKDPFIKAGIFEFKRLQNLENDKKIQRFYTYLKEDFFKTKIRRIDRLDRNEIIEVYDIPKPKEVLDFITPPKITLPEERMTIFSLGETNEPIFTVPSS